MAYLIHKCIPRAALNRTRNSLKLFWRIDQNIVLSFYLVKDCAAQLFEPLQIIFMSRRLQNCSDCFRKYKSLAQLLPMRIHDGLEDVIVAPMHWSVVLVALPSLEVHGVVMQVQKRPHLVDVDPFSYLDGFLPSLESSFCLRELTSVTRGDEMVKRWPPR